jgi:hypothetical protein
MSVTTKTRMSQPTSPVTVKRGKPSKPGTVVDTSKAKVIPPSPEVRVAEDAARSKAKTDATIGKAVAKMTASPIKRGGVKKAVAIQKARSTGNGSGPAAQLTMEWTGKDGKDVKVKDRVRTAEGVVIDVIGRWTRKPKDGSLIPCVTGRIVTLPAGATVAAGDTKKSDGKGRTVGDRQSAIAAGCQHIKK